MHRFDARPFLAQVLVIRIKMNKQRKSLLRLYLKGAFRLFLLTALLSMTLFNIPSNAAENIWVHSTVNLAATTTDFDAGEKVSSSNTINWWATNDWIITVKSLDANLGQSDDLSYTKPLSDLLWQLSSGGSWASITTTDATVTTGTAGTSSFDVDYKFLLSWTADKPGSYGATFQYTITAQ